MNPELTQFIERCCIEQSIDESHGMKHAKACVEWVEKLLSVEENVTEEERTLAIYSAALHDMCDKKYTNVEIASKKIHVWLIQQGWQKEMADVLIRIVTSMSYSSLKTKMVDGKPVFPDFGPWQRAYHIVRHADLLDGYLVGRCFLYTKHKHPRITDEVCWEIVKELFKVRMFRYVDEGWVSLPEAVKLAQGLELRARWNLLDREFTY